MAALSGAGTGTLDEQMVDIAMGRSATYNGYGDAMSPPLPPLIQMHREN